MQACRSFKEMINEIEINGMKRSYSFIDEYLVNDCPIESKENVKIVFVLESPHIDEVWDTSEDPCRFKIKKKGSSKRFPAAGFTGCNMTKTLIKVGILGNDKKNYKPLGELISKRLINNIAIMNVCSIPMQRNAYEDSKKIENNYLIDIIESIKNKCQIGKHGLNFDNDNERRVSKVLRNNLRQRLECIKNALIIPCGWVAQNFITAILEENAELITIKQDDNTELSVRHPCGIDSWDLKQDILSEIKNMLRNT